MIWKQRFFDDLAVLVHLDLPVVSDSQYLFYYLHECLRVVADKCYFGSLDVLSIIPILLHKYLLLLLLFSHLDDLPSLFFSVISPNMIDRVVASAHHLALVLLIFPDI